MTSPAPDKAQKRICLGKVSAAHGIKGLVKILPYCENLSLLNGTLYTDEQGNDTLDISLRNQAGKYILASIDGVNSREDAQALKYSLYISRDALPDPEDGEYYLEDLQGLAAFEEGKLLGTVTAVQNFGAGDLLEITPLSGHSFFVPFMNEYVGDVDLTAGTVIVNNTSLLRID